MTAAFAAFAAHFFIFICICIYKCLVQKLFCWKVLSCVDTCSA